MNRRDFLRFLIASPLAAPLVPAQPSARAGPTLFLIGDDPQDHLPAILAGLEKRTLVQRKRFAFRGAHPLAAELRAALARDGWEPADGKPPASLTLAFQVLRQPVPPSFALVRNGRIMDLRTRELGRLWREMNGRSPLSTGLTIASFRGPAPLRSSGVGATVFIDGDRRETLSLKKDRLRRYRTLRGEVLIRIEGGQAEVLSSSCRHKICQSSAPAFLAGERIVCAPNHFLLTIDGTRFVDTVTG